MVSVRAPSTAVAASEATIRTYSAYVRTLKRPAEWNIPGERVACLEAAIKFEGHHRRARALPLSFGSGTAQAVR